MFKESDNPFVTCIECDRCKGTGYVDRFRSEDDTKVCKKCNGSGHFAIPLNTRIIVICKYCHGSGNYTYCLTCSCCDGYGFLDWEELIIGKKKEIELDITNGIGDFSLSTSLPKILGMTVYDLIGMTMKNGDRRRRR